jgi:hypothetical protein
MVDRMSDHPAELYERDFYAWSQAQARELRRFAASRPNLRHLAEEIADLGKEQRNSLRSWTQRIIQHLLLLQHSPARDPRPHWIGEIAELRTEIERRLTPTLERDLRRQPPRLREAARRVVVRTMEAYGETEAVGRLPAAYPYTLDQLLGDWWPEGADLPWHARSRRHAVSVS